MTGTQAAMLFTAAMLGGMMNAVAGGGSFFSFPALLFAGVPAIDANATNTFALWPGSAASSVAYRRELQRRAPGLVGLSAISLTGGLLGALLLLNTRETTFERLIPYLLLFATLTFAGSRRLVRALRARRARLAARPGLTRALLGSGQFLIAIYGGFFGGGIGILMLAALSLSGMEDIHEMNAVKTLLATLINGISVVTFVLAGLVRWPEAVVMVLGAIAGGYGAVLIARRIAPDVVRGFVIAVGFALTLLFFYKFA